MSFSAVGKNSFSPICSDKNEKIGVLLTDRCHPTSQQSSLQPSTPTTDTPVASATWPHTAVTLKTVSGSRPTAARPDVQTVPQRTTHNKSSTLTESTRAGAQEGVAEATPSLPVSLSSLIPIIADIDSTVNTTVAPEFALNTVTTAGVLKPPHNYTNLNNVTTPTSYPDTPEVPNAATDNVSNNIATISSPQEQPTAVIAMTNTTGNMSTTTAGHSHTRKDYLTTVTSPSNPVYFNSTTTAEAYKTDNRFTVNHHNHTNTSPSAAEYSTTPPSNNATTTSTSSGYSMNNDGNPDNGTVTTRSINTPSHHTTTSYNYTTQYNIPDSLKAHNNTTGTFTPNYNTTDANTFMYDHYNTTVNGVTTAVISYTTVSKNDTTGFSNTTSGAVAGNATIDTFTLLPGYTNTNNVTPVPALNSNATTVSPNETVMGSLPASAFGESVSNTTAITRGSAQLTAPLPNAVATPAAHSVTPPKHTYTASNTGPSFAGIYPANISQAKAEGPAVISSATTGNAAVGHTATDKRGGPPSAHSSIATATLPSASPTTTVFSTTKPGMWSLNVLNLHRMSR